MANRPSGRGKNVSNQSGGVHRRGDGLGGGPVGNGKTGGSFGGSGGGGKRSGGGSPLGLIIGLLVLLLGGGGGLTSLLGGGGGSVSNTTPVNNAGTSGSVNSAYHQAYYAPAASTSSYSIAQNTNQLDTGVVSGARAKYTKLKGNGKDTTTIMLYMCGTDLESRSGMATNDLQEIINANTGDNINILIYTGGCKAWKNNVVDSKVNQIYQIKGGKMLRLVKDDGQKAMTDPATLASFIKWCKKNYPADRMDLILWDHGGGSVSGYGYDEKFSQPHSMSLAGIKSALDSANTKFDFIGYDACLMATAENALMLNDYADYLIASEETEPGVGWYYTPWLKALSQNPSMPTLEIGKNIVDSFVDECARSCRGQSTTLSVIDLAEFAYTVPDALKDFAQDTTKLIKGDDFQKVAVARSGAREFASSNKIDQVDLVDLARRIGTDKSKALAEALLGAVKYNRYSSNMTNSYGVSIFFPNKKTSYVKPATSTYKEIELLDDEYSKCIREFAALEASGQAVSSGANYGSTGDPFGSLLGSLGQGGSSANAFGSLGSLGSLIGSSSPSGSSSQTTVSSDMAMQLLQALLSSAGGSDRAAFLEEMDVDLEETSEVILNNSLNAGALIWSENDKGQPVILLNEEQWSNVKDVNISMFYDDGQGFIDLGLDSTIEFDDNNDLMGPSQTTWLAVNDQIVAYYQTGSLLEDDQEVYEGYIPVLLNGERAKLQVRITCDENGTTEEITGALIEYRNGETDASPKMMEIEAGDKIDFVADYYSYEGDYQDSYMIGEAITVGEEGLSLSDMTVDGNVRITYMFTDLFGQEYWSTVMPN